MAPEVNQVEKGLQLIAQDSWDDGLSIIWEEIDKGDQDARLELAWLFDSNGLHSFSNNHWIYLFENSKEEAIRDIAAQGAASNFTWMRNYKVALELSSGRPGLEQFQGTVETKAAADFFSNPESFSNSVSDFLSTEAELLRVLDAEFSRATQLQLCRVRDALAGATSYLTYSATPALKSVSLQVPIAGSLTKSMQAESALLNPIEAWWNLADAASILLADFEVEWEQAPTDETFQAACQLGSSALAQAFLAQGDHSIADQRKADAVQNISAGLLNLGAFAGFIYAGLV